MLAGFCNCGRPLSCSNTRGPSQDLGRLSWGKSSLAPNLDSSAVEGILCQRFCPPEDPTVRHPELQPSRPICRAKFLFPDPNAPLGMSQGARHVHSEPTQIRELMHSTPSEISTLMTWGLRDIVTYRRKTTCTFSIRTHIWFIIIFRSPTSARKFVPHY